MSDIFEEVGPAVGLVIFLAVVFFWVVPELLGTFSGISGNETSPIFSYVVGVLLIIAVILFFVKR